MKSERWGCTIWKKKLSKSHGMLQVSSLSLYAYAAHQLIRDFSLLIMSFFADRWHWCVMLLRGRALQLIYQLQICRHFVDTDRRVSWNTALLAAAATSSKRRIQRRIQQRIHISSKPHFSVKFRTLNTKMTFILLFKVLLTVKFKGKGRVTRYRRNYVSMRTKIVSNDS